MEQEGGRQGQARAKRSPRSRPTRRRWRWRRSRAGTLAVIVVQGGAEGPGGGAAAVSSRRRVRRPRGEEAVRVAAADARQQPRRPQAEARAPLPQSEAPAKPQRTPPPAQPQQPQPQPAPAKPKAQLRLRPHRHRRRPRRLRGGHPRRATQEARPLRREGKPRRHVPQLGLHPDQGAARRRRTSSARSAPKRPSTAITFDNLKIDFQQDRRPQPRRSPTSCRRASAPCSRSTRSSTRWRPAQLLGPHKVQVHDQGRQRRKSPPTTSSSPSARGRRSCPASSSTARRSSPSREAMTLPKQPKRIAIIGAGAIGCEFADFYNAIGTEVDDRRDARRTCCPTRTTTSRSCSSASSRSAASRCSTKTKTDKVEKTRERREAHALRREGRRRRGRRRPRRRRRHRQHRRPGGAGGEARAVQEPREGRPAISRPTSKTSGPIGDCIAHWPSSSMAGYRHPDLAHVAHHEAVYCVERIFGVTRSPRSTTSIIPGCTYTHPQVASMGLTEKKAREQDREI